MALRDEAAGNGSFPEQPSIDRQAVEMQRSMKRAGLALAGIAAGAALLWALARRS